MTAPSPSTPRRREDKLAPKPANLSFEQAAVVPISAGTALQALVDIGGVEAGQRVLVTGASGGVGTYAVQIAKAYGAEVTGVASTSKVDLVRDLGADDVLDYTKDDFADGSRHYDLIVDIAGNPSVSRLRSALTKAGTAVIVGGEGGGSLTGMGRAAPGCAPSRRSSRQQLTMCVSRERATDLERLTPFIELGQVRPSLDRVFPLEQAADAMRHLASGKARGKIGISVVPEIAPGPSRPSLRPTSTAAPRVAAAASALRLGTEIVCTVTNVSSDADSSSQNIVTALPRHSVAHITVSTLNSRWIRGRRCSSWSIG